MVRLATPLILSIATSSSASLLTVAAQEESNIINGSEIFRLAKSTLERALNLGDHKLSEEKVVGEKKEETTATAGGNNNNSATPSAEEDGSNDVTTTATATNPEGGANSAPTTSTDSNNSNEDDKNLTYDGSDLIEWINSNGGFIHPNARIGLDPTGQYRGVFVKSLGEGGTEEGIEDGDIIARIPWDLIVTTEDYSYDIYWNCDALQSLYREFQLGDDSKYAPYVNYLKNQPRGRIPNEWSDAGRKLLETITDRTGKDDDDQTGLPPVHHHKDYEDTWLGECKGEDTELAKAAFYQFTSRDEDTLMVPFYDMHNHSNDPKKLNTISKKPDRKGLPFLLHAIKDIGPGEQIFISYNRCHGCWFDETYRDCSSFSYYGTPDVFDIFGFVEDFPQMWKFQIDIGKKDRKGNVLMDELKFCLERPKDDGPLVVTFGDNYTPFPADEEPVMENIQYLGSQLKRLRELETTIKNDAELMETMPRHEWDMIWTYHEAMITSISAAVLASGLVKDDDSGTKIEEAPLVGDSEENDSSDVEGSNEDKGSSDDDESSSDDGASSDDESSSDDGEEEEVKNTKLKMKSGVKGREARSEL